MQYATYIANILDKVYLRYGYPRLGRLPTGAVSATGIDPPGPSEVGNLPEHDRPDCDTPITSSHFSLAGG